MTPQVQVQAWQYGVAWAWLQQVSEHMHALRTEAGSGYQLHRWCPHKHHATCRMASCEERMHGSLLSLHMLHHQIQAPSWKYVKHGRDSLFLLFALSGAKPCGHASALVVISKADACMKVQDVRSCLTASSSAYIIVVLARWNSKLQGIT